MSDTRAQPWHPRHGPADRGRRRLVGSVTLGLAIPALAVAGALFRGEPTSSTVWTVAVAAAVGVALALGFRWPQAALGVALAGTITLQIADSVNPVLFAACEIAVFNLARLRPRPISAPATLVAVAVLFGVAWADLGGPATEPRTLIVAAWTIAAFALGDGVRTQRAYVDALAERARRADETREQEARARVAEERVRIARELHDVVAHHIAVINVHAGLARRALGRDSGVVDSSLGHVQEAARTVLDELGTVLRVLRSDDASGSGTPAEPSPGLDRLDQLLGTFAAAGFVIRTAVTGRPREIDRTCDLAAFRIIQESLTNASKYGAGGQAELSLVHGADDVTIAVSNVARLDPAQHSATLGARVGQGLVGMRERAAGCGGTLTAHLDGEGVFRLQAVIPYRPRLGPATAPTSADDSRRPLPRTRCDGRA